MRLYCSKCKITAVKGTFCTKCGTKLQDLDNQQADWKNQVTSPSPTMRTDYQSSSSSGSSASTSSPAASKWKANSPSSSSSNDYTTQSTAPVNRVDVQNSPRSGSAAAQNQPAIQNRPAAAQEVVSVSAPSHDQEEIEQQLPPNEEVSQPVRITDYQKDAERFPEFSSGDIEVFISSFEEFDVDGSGSINIDELDAAFVKMGQGCSREKLQEIIDEVDEDKSGEIEWVEFLKVMSMLYPDRLADYRERFLVPARRFPEFSRGDLKVFIDVFREFDVDESGTIDNHELAAVFTSLGQGVNEFELGEMMKKYDTDLSGEIEFGEFLEMMRSFYPAKRQEFEEEYYGVSDKFPEFRRSEVDVFIQSFREFDADGSGSIDSQELQQVFRSMGQGVTERKLQEIIDSYTTEGVLYWPDFFKMMRSFYPEKKREYAVEFYGPAKQFPEFTRGEIDVFGEAFREYDKDGSNTIDIEELQHAFARMGHGMTRDKLQTVIENVDTNNSGEVTWLGFLKIMRFLYPSKLEEYEQKFIEPSKRFKELPREKIDTFANAFREIDEEETGRLNADDLCLMFGDNYSLNQLITDYVKDETLDWVGFLQMMSSFAGGQSDESEDVSDEPAETTPSENKPSESKPKFQSSQERTQSSSPQTSSPTQGTNRCAACNKIVYPVETVNALKLNWHKACFKCQAEGCGITLNLKTFKGLNGKIYCAKHVPQYKATSMSHV